MVKEKFMWLLWNHRWTTNTVAVLQMFMLWTNANAARVECKTRFLFHLHLIKSQVLAENPKVLFVCKVQSRVGHTSWELLKSATSQSKLPPFWGSWGHVTKNKLKSDCSSLSVLGSVREWGRNTVLANAVGNSTLTTLLTPCAEH